MFELSEIQQRELEKASAMSYLRYNVFGFSAIAKTSKIGYNPWKYYYFNHLQ
jgi:hypothetical protein